MTLRNNDSKILQNNSMSPVRFHDYSNSYLLSIISVLEHACMHACIFLPVCLSVNGCLCLSVCVCICWCNYLCLCLYVCTLVCMNMCVCLCLPISLPLCVSFYAHVPAMCVCQSDCLCLSCLCIPVGCVGALLWLSICLCLCGRGMCVFVCLSVYRSLYLHRCVHLCVFLFMPVGCASSTLRVSDLWEGRKNAGSSDSQALCSWRFIASGWKWVSFS